MKKNNKLFIAIILIIIIVTIYYATNSKEYFGATSPGTLVQLESSHVPTERDLFYYINVYPKVVRKEITNMTGSDPGDIALYPFQ